MILLWLACVAEPEVERKLQSQSLDTAESTPPLHVDPYDSGQDVTPLITDPCLNRETGPDRDCGYAYRGLTGCLVGTNVLYDFGPDPELELQALRICRTTSDRGIPCVYIDAVAQTVGRNVRFQCPRLVPGGVGEIGGNGGGFSIYTAEAWP